jgi:2-polyprenyl-3-methyl-5-hydroxy-6-metoxy-1,4-benzoquinol methylase
VIGARELLACPACRGTLTDGWRCRQCTAEFSAPDGIPNLRLDGGARTETVRRFYEGAPFPGYPPVDNLTAFRARAERSAFVQSLDRAIAGDARIADVGCGTGQMSLYLARADRVIVGADLSRAALRLGQDAAERYGIDRVQFVETDLHRPALKPGSFDVVYSSGVLHHTRSPRDAFRQIAPLAKPGGIVVVGVYNTFARIPLRLRRAAARLTRLRVVPFDPILRERQHHATRRQAWLRDQYAHPEEHSHTLAETKRWLRENDVDYLRSYPSTVFGDEPDDLFAPAVDDWSVEAWLAQIGWSWTLGGEGGLFITIGRRRDAVPHSR